MTSIKSVHENMTKLKWVVDVIVSLTSHHDIEGFDKVMIDGKEVEVEKVIAQNKGRMRTMTESKNTTRKMDRSFQDSLSKLMAFEEFKIKLYVFDFLFILIL